MHNGCLPWAPCHPSRDSCPYMVYSGTREYLLLFDVVDAPANPAAIHRTVLLSCDPVCCVTGTDVRRSRALADAADALGIVSAARAVIAARDIDAAVRAADAADALGIVSAARAVLAVRNVDAAARAADAAVGAATAAVGALQTPHAIPVMSCHVFACQPVRHTVVGGSSLCATVFGPASPCGTYAGRLWL